MSKPPFARCRAGAANRRDGSASPLSNDPASGYTLRFMHGCGETGETVTTRRAKRAKRLPPKGRNGRNG